MNSGSDRFLRRKWILNKCNTQDELLEHVSNPILVLKESRRVARKKILITVPNEYCWDHNALPFQNPTHRRFYTGVKLARHLIHAGFSRNSFRIDCLNYGGWSFWVCCSSI